MLVKSGDRKIKQYPNPSDGEMKSFYLERQQFMDPTKEYSVAVEINGYKYHAVFGRRQTLPVSVINELKNAKSAIHPMANTRRVDTALGGEGRTANELMSNQSQVQYVNDYNVVEE